MPSPTFNGEQIFDSIDGSSTKFSEGVLFCTEYSKIVQRIHFNGANGDTILTHGWPSRSWKFTGIISVADNDISALSAIFNGIESYIDEADRDLSSYHALVDSFGFSYSYAQIHSLNILEIRKAEPGWVAQVEVHGILDEMGQEGT